MARVEVSTQREGARTGVSIVGGGPEQVRQACEAAVAALVAGMPVSGVVGSRAEWAAAVGAVQQVLNVAAGVQDAAIARLAAIEPEWLEDGTLVESHRGLGHVALDAPAIVSGVLTVAAVHAERRVTAAVRLAADGPAGSASESGLGGLHAAMTAGVLDPYRASVVAEELAYAPGEVAQAVVTALAPYFAVEDGTGLRRRCRRVLARVSPDLLLQRAKRARASCGLRRYAVEPGVDRWEGTFPSEDAARAWAAIDALAHQYVKDGVCSNIEQARGKALSDLVTSNATIQTVITLTIPATSTATAEVAGAEPAEAAQVVDPVEDATETRDGDLVEVTGLLGTQQLLVPRGWVTTTVNQQRENDPRKVTTAECHPVTGALLDPDHSAPRESGTDTDSVDARAEITPDADHDEAAVPVPGHASTHPGAERAAVTTETAPSGTDSYRPSAALARRIRARDRRCRFPGCTVAAVFCDLDHVRPWPAGPTNAANLVCLCRRHHRIKQRPGWHLTLHPDGQATWTDPTGVVRTTEPVDALHPLVLPDTAAPTPAIGTAATTDTGSASAARVVLSDGPHSDLEFALEHHAAALPWSATTTWRDHHGHRHHTDLISALDLLGHQRDDEPDTDDHEGFGHLTHNRHRPRPTCRPGERDPWARWRRTHTARRRDHPPQHDDPPPF